MRRRCNPAYVANLIAALVIVMDARPIDAEPDVRERAAAEPSPKGVAVSLGPGFFLHGAGLWASGDKQGGKRLMVVEGVGLSMLTVAGVLIAATGASRKIASQAIPLGVVGTGIFFQSWFADIYGSTGGGRRRAAPRLSTPPLTLEMGGLYVRDDQFDYGPFTHIAGAVRIGAWTARSAVTVALRGDNQRVMGEGSYRLWGENGRLASGDGSSFDIATTLDAHRFGPQQFVTTSIDVAGRGRIDGRRIGASIRGSFADIEVGVGLEATGYKTGRMTTDVTGALLARFAYGLYIGNRTSSVRGEASFYYDHRRDEFAGGVSPTDALAGGFLGFFGLGVDLDIGDRFGVISRLEGGSAIVVALALRARFGEVQR